MSLTAIQALFAELGQQLGMAELALDENNHCILNIDDGNDIHLEYLESEDLLLLVSALPPAAEKHQAKIYDILLKGNYLWQDTYGATLAIHPETDAIIIEHKMRIDAIEPGSLQDHIAGLDTLVRAWEERIGEVVAEQDTPSSDTAPRPQDMNHMLRG
ncbi:type III secretion system chaperone [Thalassospira lucentensis]|uniref:type III secretion system chaperone n=1 Tax=Thalassospira lucentensis TaxID=168935 RepID=UPI00142D231B|nr:type III secretion system chaperone [Thalassospira lucentensis]NIZ02152.1 type III secretion system chaperone [Thalassospira lucentensis]